MSSMKQVSLHEMIVILESLAPPEGAAEWDNTGLILEAGAGQPVSCVLLTLDLTAEVAREALEMGADLIVSYHPPIFSGLRKLVRSDPVAAPLLDLAAGGVSVYSPHTALDAAPGGMADWLAGVFDFESCEAVEGSGRKGNLKSPLSPAALGGHLQTALGLPYVRRSLSPSGPAAIRSVALCPGAGASLLADQAVDAVVTGEMKHHDVLAFVRRGVHVFISEHSHTERPYLPVFRERLLAALPEGVAVNVSSIDRDPLEWVNHHA